MEKLKTENLPESIPLNMYQISGHDEADPEKYITNKKQDGLIKKASEKFILLYQIRHAPEEECWCAH